MQQMHRSYTYVAVMVMGTGDMIFQSSLTVQSFTLRILDMGWTS
jgi:hypothetical protein